MFDESKPAAADRRDADGPGLAPPRRRRGELHIIVSLCRRVPLRPTERPSLPDLEFA